MTVYCERQASSARRPKARWWVYTVQQDPERVRAVERQHLVADISKIGEATGWRPAMDLEAALADTATYYGFR